MMLIFLRGVGLLTVDALLYGFRATGVLQTRGFFIILF